MNENEVDIQLIKEYQKGNQKAFEQLVNRYQYKVLKIVNQYIKDPSESLDLTQETFIRAYRGLIAFRCDSSFYTWIYKVAVNTAKNFLIHKGRRIPSINFEIQDFDNFNSQYNSDIASPELNILCDEMQLLIYTTIEMLPEELKTTLMLREVEGLSYEQISSLMKCPIGTVRSRIFRARELIDKKINSN